IACSGGMASPVDDFVFVRRIRSAAGCPLRASFLLALPGPTPLADGVPSLPGHTCRHSARRDSDDHAYLTYSPRHRFEHSRVNQAHPDERYGQHGRLERAERRPPTGPPPGDLQEQGSQSAEGPNQDHELHIAQTAHAKPPVRLCYWRKQQLMASAQIEIEALQHGGQAPDAQRPTANAQEAASPAQIAQAASAGAGRSAPETTPASECRSPERIPRT